MPDENGRLRNIEEWIRQLDQKADTILARLDSKPDSTRVDRLEERTRHMELKQAGIAGAISAVVVWFRSWLA